MYGLDSGAGLARTQGNATLYRRLVLKFRDSYEDFAGEFTRACNDQDPEAASRYAHTLKGVAANIGANGVAQAARSLEHACRDGAPQEDLAGLLEQVSAELTPLLSGLADFVEQQAPAAETESPDTPPDPARAAELLQRLASLLDDCDADAADLVEELRPVLSASAQASDFRKLERLVDAYEFDEASDVVREMMEASA